MKTPAARRLSAVLLAAALLAACVTNPVTGRSELSFLGEEPDWVPSEEQVAEAIAAGAGSAVRVAATTATMAATDNTRNSQP